MSYQEIVWFSCAHGTVLRLDQHWNATENLYHYARQEVSIYNNAARPLPPCATTCVGDISIYSTDYGYLSVAIPLSWIRFLSWSNAQPQHTTSTISPDKACFSTITNLGLNIALGHLTIDSFLFPHKNMCCGYSLDMSRARIWVLSAEAFIIAQSSY